MSLTIKWHNHIKTYHGKVAAAILLLLLLAGMTGCQSKPGSSSEPGLSLGIASVPNLRDLGGYKTRDGATVVPRWNYILRLYQPNKEILDGTWTFTKPEPVE